MTHKQYQQLQGITQRAAAYRLKFVGLEFSQHQELSRQQLEQLNERFSKGRKVMQRSSPRATLCTPAKNHFVDVNEMIHLADVAQKTLDANKQELETRRKRFPARQLLLDTINAVELVFFAYGMVKLFGAAGIIPALIPIAFYLFTILDLKQGGQSYRSDVGLFVCALLALGFMWVHGQTFNVWLPGQFYTNLSFAGAVSVISWLALVQSIKKDEV
jgi:hypothetical protein